MERGRKISRRADSGDFYQDSFQISVNFLVAKSQNSDSGFFNLAVTDAVGPLCVARIVDLAV